MEQWLIRTYHNRILGPYPAEELKTMILGGKLDLRDEICPGNGFWFYIQDRDHVREFLQIEFPQSPVDQDHPKKKGYSFETEEITQTTHIVSLKPSSNGKGNGKEEGESPTHPSELSAIKEENEFLQEVRNEVYPRSRGGKAWAIIAIWILIGAAALVVFSLTRLTR